MSFSRSRLLVRYWMLEMMSSPQRFFTTWWDWGLNFMGAEAWWPGAWVVSSFQAKSWPTKSTLPMPIQRSRRTRVTETLPPASSTNSRSWNTKVARPPRVHRGMVGPG